MPLVQPPDKPSMQVESPTSLAAEWTTPDVVNCTVSSYELALFDDNDNVLGEWLPTHELAMQITRESAATRILPGKTYYIKVRGWAPIAGHSDWSPPSDYVTMPSMSAPELLVATPRSSTSLRLTWTPPRRTVECTVDRYHVSIFAATSSIQAVPGNADSRRPLRPPVLVEGRTWCDFSDLESGSSYDFRVQADSAAAGTSDSDWSIPVMLPLVLAPEQPTVWPHSSTSLA
eukprot:7385299-Prymnesium_polylepis.1